MAKRMDYYKVAPEALAIMMSMDAYINSTSIDPKLIELIKIRASQINGCAFCLNMHAADAKKRGESDQRIFCVGVWEECAFYSEEEKAALELTEHVTLVPHKRVPDQVYNRVRQHYDEKGYVDLIMIINQINSWNRISIAMGNVAK